MDWGEQARRLVGVKFRAQGRDPATGLDCVGLALAVYGFPRQLARADYQLRGNHLAELKAGLLGPFRRVSIAKAGSGDLLLFRVAGDQFHLGVMTGRGIVHADAGLRKVVERPGMAPWPLIAAYRKRQRPKKAN